MDRVRLGRVLGRGARLAARTAFEALDAATAANPSPQTVRHPMERRNGSARSVSPKATVFAPRQPVPSRPRTGALAPLRRASRAVSLEVSGSFFALFALSFTVGAWHARGDLYAGSHGVARFALYLAVALFFLYCSVSSFVRARRLS